MKHIPTYEEFLNESKKQSIYSAINDLCQNYIDNGDKLDPVLTKKIIKDQGEDWDLEDAIDHGIRLAGRSFGKALEEFVKKNK